VIVLMSIELILNAVNLNLVAFSRLWDCKGRYLRFRDYRRGGRSAVGLGILIAFFPE
jgi:NADH-quinone oxidoreductase subunit K